MRRQQILRYLGEGRLRDAGLPAAVVPAAAFATVDVATAAVATSAVAHKVISIPPEFSPRDYAAYLLSIDAEIEHCLMVQYLYGAYSMGGPQVPPEYRELVREWQEVILGIAKEEMGHLMSVQNVLRLIGAPLHLERDDYPWDTPFYPFPFMLEPLTLDSLAKYVFTESPEHWKGGALGDEIRARVDAQADNPHKVAELFGVLIPLIQNPQTIPDEAFDPDTWPFQADWAEWGRGYHGGQRGNLTRSGIPQTPDVLVVPLASRDDAVSALNAVATQGEATSGDQPSHFVRFLSIYVEMVAALEGRTITPEQWDAARPADMGAATWRQAYREERLKRCTHRAGWAPSRAVAVNPYVALDTAELPEQGGTPTTPITHPESRLWAHLQNVRYRMLLDFLSHSFALDGGLRSAGRLTPRGTVINAAFGEMYNLRALAEVLMGSPVSDNPEDGFAGPPFQTPYTLNIPISERDRWRGHLDRLEASRVLMDHLLAICAESRRTYLYALREADEKLGQLARTILAGSVDPALI
ncbi:ferritin-like domain-containing protein [Acidovorax sp. NCPPB 4044]|uniref:ferritin-like domain-containing protein n=1 Tax=Acidovorax sp. NCPPB 4044 TaxID=2940490 RepID=UPI00230216FD|nr:ferritin-like domain-containing protein [Acidovorax sp. NCPPB 4044]MDA8519759.1 ferritin-like protein [Acidovorax sp. NCPPB 4044]